MTIGYVRLSALLHCCLSAAAHSVGYITHYPWIYVQKNWAAHHKDAPIGTHIWVGVSVFMFTIAIAYACLKLYDEPVREWLKVHWLKKKAATPH